MRRGILVSSNGTRLPCHVHISTEPSLCEAGMRIEIFQRKDVLVLVMTYAHRVYLSHFAVT